MTPATDTRTPGSAGATPVERDVIANGMRLHYLEWPAPGRDVLILLHGGGLSAHTWDAIAADLADRHHCYALDLRGHGESEWSPTLEYNIDAHTQDLEGFVDHLGLDRFLLLGHSLGAFTALRYAVTHSNQITGLVIVDATPFLNQMDEVDRLRRFMVEQTEFESVEDAVNYTLRFQPQRDPDSLHESVYRALRQQRDGRWVWKHDRRCLDGNYITEVIEDARALLDDVDQIRCPTLVIRGSDGCPAEDASRFAALLSNARFVTVDAAGHNVHRDNPAGFLNVLRSFLDEHRALP